MQSLAAHDLRDDRAVGSSPDPRQLSTAELLAVGQPCVEEGRASPSSQSLRLAGRSSGGLRLALGPGGLGGAWSGTRPGARPPGQPQQDEDDPDHGHGDAPQRRRCPSRRGTGPSCFTTSAASGG
ncbi:hypothetical protein Krad_2640 [Kineococcus radiotolerans SRS30216 = ATCC BAA-149]|uniref:Uncharacterized protein n=1 Tax=Kineococcus radiotolerans (strain ATCC BAA-149 / DSM 14245 / SRS30216) TaxID=266940 RepID=A6WBC3_KINRD|nr:hypothetical protein Krad_2640 [Kineococcus radiotolerans SRS30216 = ATCC BAA-149]